MLNGTQQSQPKENCRRIQGKVKGKVALVLVCVTLAFASTITSVPGTSSGYHTQIGTQGESLCGCTSTHGTVQPIISPIGSRDDPSHWYAGSQYPWWLPEQKAREIYVTITVPSHAPELFTTYFVILSAWDSNGSYDQIGLSNYLGTWGLVYSWTTGPISNLTYNNNDSATVLTQGATYTFWISTENNVTQFGAELGTPKGTPTTSTSFWSLSAPTGGNYLILSYAYSGNTGYTNYEEVWAGSPIFNFLFYDNYWVALNNSTYSTNWTGLASINGPPSNVAVQITNNSVFVNNNYYALNPIIDQPTPITYILGQTGNSITWHPSSQIPDFYVISVIVGSLSRIVAVNSWNGGPITFSVDGLPLGIYSIVCTIYDTSRRSVSSTVEITVVTPTEYTLRTSVAVVIILALIGLVLAEYWWKERSKFASI
jgi:hypothetical protein